MIKESKSNRTRQVQFRMDPDKVKRLLATIAYDDNMHSMLSLISGKKKIWKRVKSPYRLIKMVIPITNIWKII